MTTSTTPTSGAGWVPMRPLGPEDRPQIAAHLRALDPRDRYLRFGYPATDAHLQQYVDGLDFDRDELFGIFNRHLDLVALAHLAFPGPGLDSDAAAEFGGSVSSNARGRGWGSRMFAHAVLRARNRGLDRLFIHALSENTVMLRIARKAGGVIVRSGSETDAYVRLPPDTVASRLEQWLGDGAAQIDYRLKRAWHQDVTSATNPSE